MSKPIASLYRAHSWSGAGDGKPTKRQPHMFYRAGDIDELFDGLVKKQNRDLNEVLEQHRFEIRRYEALENFYLKELGRFVS